MASQTRCVQSCNCPRIGKLIFHLSSHKVNGCLARYSPRATTNNQATNWALDWAKKPIFGQKCQFWAKFGRFWAKNPFFWWDGVKPMVPSYKGTSETPLPCWKKWLGKLQLAARDENLDICGQKSFFCIGIASFVNRAYYQYTRGYNFPIRTTLKKFLWLEFRSGLFFGPD